MHNYVNSLSMLNFFIEPFITLLQTFAFLNYYVCLVLWKTSLLTAEAELSLNDCPDRTYLVSSASHHWNTESPSTFLKFSQLLFPPKLLFCYWNHDLPWIIIENSSQWYNFALNSWLFILGVSYPGLLY